MLILNNFHKIHDSSQEISNFYLSMISEDTGNQWFSDLGLRWCLTVQDTKTREEKTYTHPMTPFTISRITSI